MENFQEFINSIQSNLADISMTVGIRILGAILVLFIGLKIVKLLMKLLRKTPKFKTVDPGAETFIFSFLGITLKTFVFLTAIAILGVPMTNVVALLGSAGLAVGLALQGSLSNFAGGLMILIFKPFSIGDFITSSGVSGTVKEINILYTVLDTPDNIHIVVPNGSLSNATVENYTVNDTRRVTIDIGVSYDNKPSEVINTLTEIAESNPDVIKDKGIFAKVSSYDDSAITYKLRVWVPSTKYWDTLFDLNGKIKDTFDEKNISIPYPQLDVKIKKD